MNLTLRTYADLIVANRAAEDQTSLVARGYFEALEPDTFEPDQHACPSPCCHDSISVSYRDAGHLVFSCCNCAKPFLRVKVADG